MTSEMKLKMPPLVSPLMTLPTTPAMMLTVPVVHTMLLATKSRKYGRVGINCSARPKDIRIIWPMRLGGSVQLCSKHTDAPTQKKKKHRFTGEMYGPHLMPLEMASKLWKVLSTF